MLREKGGGVFEGKPISMTFSESKESIISSRTYKPDKGECWIDVMNRAKEFLNNIVDQYIFGELIIKDINPKILVITHGGFMKEFVNVYREIKGLEISDEIPKNTAIYAFRIECTHCKGRCKNILCGGRIFDIEMFIENDNSHLSIDH